MSILACGSAPVLPKSIRKELLEELVTGTKFTAPEVKALYARFRRLAPSGFLYPEQFKQTLGVLGLTDDPFLPDRMFQVFDIDEDGRLSFAEFAGRLAVMIRGTEDEKLTLSFEMMAGKRGATGILFEDFQRLIGACNTLMSSLVAPSERLTSDEEIHRLFQELAEEGESSQAPGGELKISLDSYKAAAQHSEDFLRCLGIDTFSSTKKKEPRMTRMSQRTSSYLPGSVADGAPVAIHSPPLAVHTIRRSPPTPPEGHVTVPIRELAQLRGSLDRVRELLKQQNQAPAQRSLSALLATSCGVSSRSTVLGVDGNLESEVTALEDVCVTLDRVLGKGFVDPLTEGEDSGENSIAKEQPLCKLQWSSPLVASSSRPNLEGHELYGSERERGRRASVQMQNNTGAFRERRNRRSYRLLGPKKGLAVHFGHENWNMVLSMMIGIRMSVGRSRHEMARELQPVDFIMREKFSILPRLANIFDSAVSQRVSVTRFIDHAPVVFQRIRSSFGIREEDYLHSVGPEQLLGNMVLGNLSSLSELSSEGKSGAFFYYTADGNYLMKTVTEKEFVLFWGMLKRYYEHITQYPGTLIVRFLGLHCLSVHKHRKGFPSTMPESRRKLYFVVMANQFNTPFEIHRRYDLKGSWIGRSTPPEKFDPAVALKDVDFQQANERIRVGEERKAKLVKQIDVDSSFLSSNNIIDYSLLIGIHDMDPAEGADLARQAAQEKEMSHSGLLLARQSVVQRGPLIPGTLLVSPASPGQVPRPNPEVPAHRADCGGLLSSDQRSLYFIGIIDILTPYDTFKVFEHNFKALRYGRKGVSCCPPAQYADRFAKFMQEAFA